MDNKNLFDIINEFRNNFKSDGSEDDKILINKLMFNLMLPYQYVESKTTELIGIKRPKKVETWVKIHHCDISKLIDYIMRSDQNKTGFDLSVIPTDVLLSIEKHLRGS